MFEGKTRSPFQSIQYGGACLQEIITSWVSTVYTSLIIVVDTLSAKLIFKHSFASKDYVWVALNTFKGEQFDTKNGLWWAENATDQRMVILLANVSPPLTVATEDSTIWFLDVQAFNL